MASDSPQRGALASQINVTPLVDVMLVLLIIFMVTAPIIQQGVEVNLPKVKAQALPGKEEQFIVSITRNRDVYLNDTRISPEQLSEKLRAISVERPNRQVFLRADDAVPYGEVVRTMAAIKAAGIEDVGMVTEMPGGVRTRGWGAGRSVAAPGLSRDDQRSRGGYVIAIVVSAIAHVGVVIFVLFVVPRLCRLGKPAPLCVYRQNRR